MTGTAVLIVVCVAITGDTPQRSPITPAMREALSRIEKVHGGMEQKKIDEAVETFHEEIARQAPAAFVPLAIPHLMRLAPRYTRTRIVLRRAMTKGWIEESIARAYLVQAGDTPGPHIRWLDEALGDRDPKVRRGAMSALGTCGAAAESALPRLRKLVGKGKARPEDFRRDYTTTSAVPEHVHAYWALILIEAATKKP